MKAKGGTILWVSDQTRVKDWELGRVVEGQIQYNDILVKMSQWNQTLWALTKNFNKIIYKECKYLE